MTKTKIPTASAAIIRVSNIPLRSSAMDAVSMKKAKLVAPALKFVNPTPSERTATTPLPQKETLSFSLNSSAYDKNNVGT